MTKTIVRHYNGSFYSIVSEVAFDPLRVELHDADNGFGLIDEENRVIDTISSDSEIVFGNDVKDETEAEEMLKRRWAYENGLFEIQKNLYEGWILGFAEGAELRGNILTTPTKTLRLEYAGTNADLYHPQEGDGFLEKIEMNTPIGTHYLFVFEIN